MAAILSIAVHTSTSTVHILYRLDDNIMDRAGDIFVSRYFVWYVVVLILYKIYCFTPLIFTTDYIMKIVKSMVLSTVESIGTVEI